MSQVNFTNENGKKSTVARWLRHLICLATLLIAVAGSASHAIANPVLTFNPATGSSGTNNNQSIGWQFNVIAPLTLTGLGWYDDGGNGLSVGHTVGIWRPDGTLITSVFVPAGVVAPLDGQFRTVFFAPIVLPTGNGYIVGGENFSTNPERLAFDVTQVVDPRIQYFDATFSALGAGFVRPTQFSAATTGFYGPSFSVDGGSTVVPEPTTMVLLGIGLAGVAGAVRRRRNARSGSEEA